MDRELAIPDRARLISQSEARRALGGTIYFGEGVGIVAWRSADGRLSPVTVDRHGMEYPHPDPDAEAMVLRDAVYAALDRRHAKRVTAILASAAALVVIAAWLFARGCP